MKKLPRHIFNYAYTNFIFFVFEINDENIKAAETEISVLFRNIKNLFKNKKAPD
jgi:hypothetical protein